MGKLQKIDERILQILREDFNTAPFSSEQLEMWDELEELYMELTEEMF